jgi:hypothetical protein
MVCYFCRHGVRERAIVCAACGAGIHYGPKVSDAVAMGVLFAAIAAFVVVGLKWHAPVATVALVAFACGAALGAWRWRGRVRFYRHVPGR